MNISINYKPHKAQAQIHDACDDDDIRFITVITGRQFGKSKLIQIQSLKWALSGPKKIVMIVSPTDAQVSKIFDEMISPLIDSGIVSSKSESSGDMFIKFTNQSCIIFRSSRSEDSLRGNTLDFLCIDEAAFIKESVYKKILLPMLTTRPNSKVLLCSTPKGKNYLYSEFNMKGKMYKAFRFTYKDNPLADRKLIEEFKVKMTDMEFRQEFMAEFVDSATLFTNIRDCEISDFEVNPSQHYYGGIDIGLVSDNTVFSVINDSGQLVYQDAFTGIEVNDLIKRLDDTFRKYNFSSVYVESNSYGLTILQLLREKWFDKVKGFNTTHKSKGDIISNLINAFSMKKIQFVQNEDLIQELNDFGYSITDTGSVKYQAITGKDDRVMSLAICYYAYNRRHISNSVPIQF